MKKTIIYYQYAKDYNFEESYFKYETMGFGEVIGNEQELIDLFRKLPTKEKNALLSKAYELAEKL